MRATPGGDRVGDLQAVHGLGARTGPVAAVDRPGVGDQRRRHMVLLVVPGLLHGVGPPVRRITGDYCKGRQSVGTWIWLAVLLPIHDHLWFGLTSCSATTATTCSHPRQVAFQELAGQ